jgi:glycerophosphoryl diester phosphodiesterase
MTAPRIVHHMGAIESQPYPPNSLERIQASLKANADVIEIDVVALADGDYLLVHDPVLESETDGSGAVGQCAAADARQLHYPATDKTEQVPVALLSGVVKAFAAHGGSTGLQIDFKNEVPFQSREPMERFVKLIEPLEQRVIVSTGADWQLRLMRRLAPKLRLGFDVHHYIDSHGSNSEVGSVSYPRSVGAYGYWDDHPLAGERFTTTEDYLRARVENLVALVPGVEIFYLHYGLILTAYRDGFNWADELANYGVQLDAWTVDLKGPESEEWPRRLADAHVSLITTNTPLAMRQFFAR